ncbi:MAG TPA: tetratricopeptide repeat protein, partial [Pirellulales bacterium]
MTTFSPKSGEPTDFDALVALAKRHERAGQLAEAAAAYRQVLALRPDLAGAHYDLGNVLLRQGKLGEAAQRYEDALDLEPKFYPAHNELGCIFQVQGKLDEAVASFEQALAFKPDYAEARNNLGNALKTQGKFDQAAAQFERALALKPGLLQALINLGAVLHRQGKLDQAAARLEQAIALEPDYAEAHHNLGNVLKDQGRLEQAIASFRRTIELRPDFAEAYNNLGSALKDQGKLDEAAACYEQALARQPDLAEAYYNRTDLKTFRAGDADLAALEALAANPGNLPPDKMLFVHFALGKAFEDVGDHRRAMEHFLQGNALKRRTFDYNEAAYNRDSQRIPQVFNAQLLDRFPAAGDPSQVPIFVLGMPRSGSTLVEQIVASHPQVHAAGELKNLDQVVRGATNSAGQPISLATWIDSLDAASLQRMGQAYLSSLPALPAGKTRITDKLPGNFLRIGLIRLILPGARIIHTMRDPADTCLSCFSRLFTDMPFCYDLGELGRYYCRYFELMAYWRSVLPAGAMLDVAYEDLVDNFEEQARRLIDFCGLPWDDRCLSFHETNRPITTSSNVQVRRPLYRSSVQRWRR